MTPELLAALEGPFLVCAQKDCRELSPRLFHEEMWDVLVETRNNRPLVWASLKRQTPFYIAQFCAWRARRLLHRERRRPVVALDEVAEPVTDWVDPTDCETLPVPCPLVIARQYAREARRGERKPVPGSAWQRSLSLGMAAA